MTENTANTYATTLNNGGTLNSGDTSMVVTSATGSPAANFRVKIENELILVTAKSGTTFTITRGIEGTTAASHADGSAVTHVLTSASLAQLIAEGASGATWVQDINESGASFSNWTALGGSWDSDGTVIRHTSVANAWQESKYNTLIPLGFPVIAEAEIRLPSAGQGTGSFVQSGIKIGRTGILFRYSGTQAILHQDFAITDYRDFAFTIALDTWYKLRAVTSGPLVSIYVDGVLKATSLVGGTGAADYFGLGGYNSLMHYRNIKLWTLRGGAPA